MNLDYFLLVFSLVLTFEFIIIFYLKLFSNLYLIIFPCSFMEGLVFAHAIDGGGGGWKSRWRQLVYQRVLRGGDVTFVKDVATFRPDIACYIIERLVSCLTSRFMSLFLCQFFNYAFKIGF